MRILHLADHTIRFNGMVHAAVDLACAQARLGNEVAVCDGGGDFDELLLSSGVRIFRIVRPRASWSSIKTFVGLFGAMRTFKPDVVHAHMVATAILGRTATRLLGIPLVTCVQNSFSRFAPLMGVGDLVITGCRAVADDMRKRGVPARKLRPILNGTIGSARAPAHPPRPMELRRPAVLTMCGLHPRKGVGDLITGFKEARASAPELNLYILGEGPHEAEYRAMVGPDDADHIHFCGAVADPRSYLRAADIFVLASLADPAPLALSEAREARMAIIATRVDGIPELLEGGRAGVLISPGAPQEIAHEITRLGQSPSTLEEWKANSQVQIGRLSVQRVAEESVKTYSECLSRKRGRAARQ